jgi:multidrug efflux pump subunit AcrA (membrane-fusion protein)
LVLAGTKQLRIRLNVEESSIALLKVGARAIVSFDAFPDLQIPAVVSEIGSAADFQLGTVEVRLVLRASDSRLKPELTADANITVAEFSQVVVVPRSSLMHPDLDPAVYVLERGIVKERPVKWSRGNADGVVIRSGLKPGDSVLTAPRTTKLGARVDARQSTPIEGK